MKPYYVNDHQQLNGDHEVHTDSCIHLPSATNRTYLGTFASCHDAVSAARRIHRQVNGCRFCANDCHTQ